MKTQKLTVLEKIGFGAGDMAVNVVISSMFLIITFFYTDVFGIKPRTSRCCSSWFEALTRSRIADGMLTDKFTTRWGRYRHYFLFLAVPFGISVFLTFTTPDFDYAGQIDLGLCDYIFVTLMFTSVTIPYIS